LRYRQSFPGIEIKVHERDSIRFKIDCPKCNDMNTHWIDAYYLEKRNNIVVSCINCNPSSADQRYKYSSNVWNLVETGKECGICKHMIWKPLQYNDCDLKQCETCPPHTQWVKYKYVGYGWNVDKVKSLNNGKHVWRNGNKSHKGYMCMCSKCQFV
jgi:hypothetical protein